jgi:hypothetical protein
MAFVWKMPIILVSPGIEVFYFFIAMRYSRKVTNKEVLVVHTVVLSAEVWPGNVQGEELVSIVLVQSANPRSQLRHVADDGLGRVGDLHDHFGTGAEIIQLGLG